MSVGQFHHFRTGKGVRMRLGRDQNVLLRMEAKCRIELNLITQSSHFGIQSPDLLSPMGLAEPVTERRVRTLPREIASPSITLQDALRSATGGCRCTSGGQFPRREIALRRNTERVSDTIEKGKQGCDVYGF
jgi:hypothetical protein